MRVVDIHTRQPRHVPFLSDKFDRFFRTPRRLMEFGGHTVDAFGQFPQNMPFRSYPVCVVVSLFPVVARRMAVLPISVSVVHAGFDAMVSTSEVQLADQPAVVASVCKKARHKGWIIREVFVTVSVDVHRARIHACEKTPSARGTDRALAVGVGKSNPLLN